MNKGWAILGGLTMALAGCEEGGSTEGLRWLGNTPHLEVDGSVGGPALALSVDGAEAADVEVFFCERNYVDGALDKIEVKYLFTHDGMPAELELSFADFDYAATPADPIAIGQADGDARTGAAMNVEFQIQTEDGTEIQDVATSGTFSLEAFTGTPGPDGLIPDGTGTFGGVLEVTLESGGSFASSFHVNCGENDVE